MAKLRTRTSAIARDRGTEAPSQPEFGRQRSVAVVGGGFGGVAAAVMLRRAGYRAVTLFEKRGRLGGVWEANTYPGAACDVPSPLYELSFASNPGWSRRYAPQTEIRAYIENVARLFGVMDYVRTDTEVISARWDDDASRWLLRTSAGDHEADVIVAACGQLSTPRLPAIKGLESFNGPVFHTAQWRHDVELTGRRVAVIGSGCSAIQVVPAIQPTVDHVDVYQRSPSWTFPKFDFAYRPRTRRLFARFPFLRRLDRLGAYAFNELGAAALTQHRWLVSPFRALSRWQLIRAIDDPALRAKVTPRDEMGCKRILATDHWYKTLTRPNVTWLPTRSPG
jgi:cation diffusion facilitator CzcD-associated flavoprotein CzcO